MTEKEKASGETAAKREEVNKSILPAKQSLVKKELYAMELRLIKKHFPGLRPRPVKIDNTEKVYGRADDDALILNLKLHRSRREVEDTLKHELIHYELRDSKKEYHGHGRAFLRRARQLDILSSIELSQCVGGEEEALTPHRTEYVKTPLADFAAGIGKELAELGELAVKLPMNVRLRFYTKVRSIELNWDCYVQAIKNGRDHVYGEVWKRRKGPRGKPCDELLTEAKKLIEQIHEVEESQSTTHDPASSKKFQRLDRKLDPIREKLSRDYDIDVY